MVFLFIIIIIGIVVLFFNGLCNLAGFIEYKEGKKEYKYREEYVKFCVAIPIFIICIVALTFLEIRSDQKKRSKRSI